jgi:Rab-like protein 5
LQSGKTWLSNFLGEATESSGDYHPTEGVRILEFESEGEDPRKGTPFRAEVELWDCSGSRRYANITKTT